MAGSRPSNDARARDKKRQAIARAYELILADTPLAEVRQQLASEFQVQLSTTHHYIAAARKALPNLIDAHEGRIIVNESLHKLERLYRKAVGAGEYGHALNIIKYSLELQGLAPTQRLVMDVAVEHTHVLPLAKFNEIRRLFGRPVLTEPEYLQLQQGDEEN